MRSRSHATLPALVAALLVIAAAAPARAQMIGTFSWMPPGKVQEAMEKDHVPAIFLFEVPGEAAAMSMAAQFANPQVIDVLKKHRYACCKISVADSKSSRPWGTYQKLADEFGVSVGTTLVVASFDRQVMALISQVIRRDEFCAFLGKTAAAHRERISACEEATSELSQAEKWIEEKKYADAVRRVKIVLDKERKLSKPIVDRAKKIDEQLQTIGNERLAEGKRLLDGGSVKEGRAILEDVASAFARFPCAKEAKEALKKAKG